MKKYRIVSRYPVYPNGSCIPYTIYFVQVLKAGILFNSWEDIKGFENREQAEELLKILQ